MYVKQQHLELPNYNYEEILQSTLTGQIFNYTPDDIDIEKKQLLGKATKGSIIDNTIPNLKNFNQFGSNKPELHKYIAQPDSELIIFVKELVKKQVALQELITENKLMPIALSTPTWTQLNIFHIDGNTIFDLYLDVLPFSKFLVINS